MAVRDFVAADAPAWVGLTNPVLQRHTSPARLLEEEARATGLHRRWVFEVQGDLQGTAHLNTSPFTPPGFMQASVVVAPQWRHQGVGQALWQTLYQHLPAGTQGLVAQVLDIAPSSLAWAERRGFVSQAHRFTSELDLTGFDEAPFAPALIRLQEQGVQIIDLQHADAATTRRYIEFIADLLPDTPDLAGHPRWSAEQVREVFHMNHDPHPEWQLLAVGPDGEWLGLTVMVRYGDLAYNEFTAVVPPARGRGLALPLKLQVIRRAQQAGFQVMRTNNHSQNAPMLAVNRALGFVQQPGKFELHLKLPHEELGRQTSVDD